VNIVTIETKDDLVAEALQLLKNFELAEFFVGKSESGIWDIEVNFNLDGYHHRFGVDCKLRPSVKDVEMLSEKCNGDLYPVLATVKATDSLVNHCRRFNVGCIDLNGRIWFRTKGIVIDRQQANRFERFRTAKATVNFFSLKSSRLARVLLSFPGRQWSQSELAGITGLSQGLLSRLLQYAGSQGWIDGSRGDWTVVRHNELIDAWQAVDIWSKRVKVRQYSVLERDMRKIATRVQEGLSGTVAFTQWFAAGLRYPYADVPIVSAYVAEFPGEERASRLGLRDVSSGGKLWLIVPRDKGVFQVERIVDGAPIVCDIQIYLDLLQVGLRGPEQAEALRAWKGFCHR